MSINHSGKSIIWNERNQAKNQARNQAKNQERNQEKNQERNQTRADCSKSNVSDDDYSKLDLSPNAIRSLRRERWSPAMHSDQLDADQLNADQLNADQRPSAATSTVRSPYGGTKWPENHQRGCS